MTAKAKEKKWPADNVERRATASLVPYARNARTHSPEQVAQIAASIREWGWTVPVLVDESGTIIAGHGRILAAQSLGIPEVPVMVATGWTDAQRRAYALADNKLAQNAGWDEELLRVEISDLCAEDFDTSLIGFAEDELAEILSVQTDGLTDPDATPEPPESPVTAPGDVWLLGNHRIICGDSTDALVVEKVLNGVQPHLMVTDPPYGVEYDPTRTSKNAAKAGKVLNDNIADWGGGVGVVPRRRGVCLACVPAYGDSPRQSRAVGL